MNAIELADELINWYPKVNLCVASAITLRQQNKEIEQLKLRKLNDEEILETWKKFPNWGNEQHILMFAKELIQKASEK